MSLSWHGQDRAARQSFRQVPLAQTGLQIPSMLQGRAALGTGSPSPAKNPFSREGKWRTKARAVHPLAQGRGGLKADSPFGIGVAVLPRAAGGGASSSAGKSPHSLH